MTPSVKTLHEAFLRQLHAVLEGEEVTPAWGAVIRAFLKDNHDKLDVKDHESEVSELAAAFLARKPPRGLDLGLDLLDS